jgi:quinol monooxygenase YgiN
MDEAVKPEFTAKLKEVFTHIEKEASFVEASLQQDIEDSGSILNYEVWRETPESFMKNQMPKDYRKAFEQAIVELKIERSPSWYTAIAEWKKV